MDGLMVDKKLKMQSLTNMTTRKIKSLKMCDLADILENMNADEKRLLLNAVKESEYNKIGHTINMSVFRQTQAKVFNNRAKDCKW